ncbi:MAG: hypothetical protein ACRDCE_18860 [Cetobacterium sp.]|uniref:hypothetical protein n=1 Tax=Cetobacterium sp. TaxID=2071632 RepID=UPI003EE44B58
MNNNLTVQMLVIGRLNELKTLHKTFGGSVFFEMGQALLLDAFEEGIEGIPNSMFIYFEVNP